METPPVVSGIKNAQVRYLEAQEGRLTYTQKSKSAQRIKEKRNMARYESLPSEYRSHIDESDYELLKNESSYVTDDTYEHPSFPYGIFTIAFLKDSLDVLLELSIIGIPVSTALSFLMTIVLFFWFLGKMQGVWWKKKTISWMWKRLLLGAVIEHIPFLKLIPTFTILVLMAHYRETKLVKIFNAVLEEMHTGKFNTKAISRNV